MNRQVLHSIRHNTKQIAANLFELGSQGISEGGIKVLVEGLIEGGVSGSYEERRSRV
jgi:hypothetical protein